MCPEPTPNPHGTGANKPPLRSRKTNRPPHPHTCAMGCRVLGTFFSSALSARPASGAASAMPGSGSPTTALSVRRARLTQPAWRLRSARTSSGSAGSRSCRSSGERRAPASTPRRTAEWRSVRQNSRTRVSWSAARSASDSDLAAAATMAAAAGARPAAPEPAAPTAALARARAASSRVRQPSMRPTHRAMICLGSRGGKAKVCLVKVLQTGTRSGRAGACGVVVMRCQRRASEGASV